MTKQAAKDVLTTDEALSRDMTGIQLQTLRQLRARSLCSTHSGKDKVHCLAIGNKHLRLTEQHLFVWATEIVSMALCCDTCLCLTVALPDQGS